MKTIVHSRNLQCAGAILDVRAFSTTPSYNNGAIVSFLPLEKGKEKRDECCYCLDASVYVEILLEEDEL